DAGGGKIGVVVVLPQTCSVPSHIARRDTSDAGGGKIGVVVVLPQTCSVPSHIARRDTRSSGMKPHPYQSAGLILDSRTMIHTSVSDSSLILDSRTMIHPSVSDSSTFTHARPVLKEPAMWFVQILLFLCVQLLDISSKATKVYAKTNVICCLTFDAISHVVSTTAQRLILITPDKAVHG
nr:hypothetical protein [Tanacetum cinerariifolium]